MSNGNREWLVGGYLILINGSVLICTGGLIIVIILILLKIKINDLKNVKTNIHTKLYSFYILV